MTTEQSTNLLEAVGLYASSVKSKQAQGQTQQELVRFVQWHGQERQFDDLSPSEVEGYAEQTLGARSRDEAVERLQSVKKFLSFANKKGLSSRNLSTHIRIPRSRTSKADRDAAERKAVQLTPEGFKRLEEQLASLREQRGPLSVDIRRAAADKDVRENVPLEAAREELGRVESRISEIEDTLEAAVLVDQGAPDRGAEVRLGSKVRLKALVTGRETTYTLVTAIEANPLEGKISDASPVGKAMAGRTAGQEIQVVTPGGKMGYRVVRVVG